MKSLGIIGGLGPMATAYFLELIIKMTDAKTDQEHLDVIVFNRPNVPDRTAYILDNLKPSPLVSMKNTAKTLESLGCSYIAAPCVTSHYILNELQAGINVPIINMLTETAEYLKSERKRKIGILATTGTISSKLFQNAFQSAGLEYEIPDEENQSIVMDLIYNYVKAGKQADMVKFNAVSKSLFDKGCDCIVLGCTELSVIKKEQSIGHGYVDALDVLARKCIELCEKPVKTEYSNLIS